MLSGSVGWGREGGKGVEREGGGLRGVERKKMELFHMKIIKSIYPVEKKRRKGE